MFWNYLVTTVQGSTLYKLLTKTDVLADNIGNMQTVGIALLTVLVALAIFVMQDLKNSKFPKLDLHTLFFEIFSPVWFVLALITVFIIPFGAYFTDSYFGGVLVIGFWLAGVAEILSVLKKIVKWMKSDNRKWKWRKKFLIEGSMNIEVWEEVWRYVKANNGDFEYFFAEIFGKLIKRELRKKRGDTDIFRCLLKSARYSVVEEYLYRLLIEDINDFPPESRVALSLRRMIQNMIITDLSNEGYLLSLYLPGNSDFNKLSGNKLENYKKVIEEIKKTTKITRKGSKNRLFILHEGIKESGQTQQ